MPNIKSAAKRMELSRKQNLRNRAIKSNMKTAIKGFTDAAASGADNTQTLYQEAVSIVDRAAAKGTIHQNAANRKKAQLTKML